MSWKREWDFKKKKWIVDLLSFNLFLWTKKSFEMILASQKCIFDKQGIWFKYSKNQKYFKNYFVKESTSANPSSTSKFYGKEGHISSTCPLRNGSQKNSNAKVKKIRIEKSKVTNLKDPRRYGYLNQLELCVVGFKKG